MAAQALVRKLKDLNTISLSVVSPYRDDDYGWQFNDSGDTRLQKYANGPLPTTPDLATGRSFKYLSEIYLLDSPNYTGNITTPVLFDSVAGKIVSNDSAGIIRYLDTAFTPGDAAPIQYSLYPVNDLHAYLRGNDEKDSSLRVLHVR